MTSIIKYKTFIRIGYVRASKEKQSFYQKKKVLLSQNHSVYSEWFYFFTLKSSKTEPYQTNVSYEKVDFISFIYVVLR